MFHDLATLSKMEFKTFARKSELQYNSWAHIYIADNEIRTLRLQMQVQAEKQYFFRFSPYPVIYNHRFLPRKFALMTVRCGGHTPEQRVPASTL